MIQSIDIRDWRIPIVAILLALSAVIVALLRNRIRRRRVERELLRLCQGDVELLERLIAFEQSRTPGQNREEAAKSASYAIRRDNH